MALHATTEMPARAAMCAATALAAVRHSRALRRMNASRAPRVMATGLALTQTRQTARVVRMTGIRVRLTFVTQARAVTRLAMREPCVALRPEHATWLNRATARVTVVRPIAS